MTPDSSSTSPSSTSDPHTPEAEPETQASPEPGEGEPSTLDLPSALNMAGTAARIIKVILDILAGTRRSQTETLQMKLLALQIQKETGGPLPVQIDFDAIEQPLTQIGNDHLIFGTTGAGKSVLGFLLAERAAAASRNVYLAGLPEWVSEHFGYKHCPDLREHLEEPSTVLIDEAGLALDEMSDRLRTRAIRRALAPRRHKGRQSIWIAQHTAMLSPEVLRFGAAVWFKRIDPFASLFDREQLQDLFSSLLAFQAHSPEDPSSSWLHLGGKWFYTTNDLPDSWTEEVSTCLA